MSRMAPGIEPLADEGKQTVKRSLRACNRCKQGKNKCSGDVPCSRCVRLKVECIYDRPMVNDPGMKRVEALETLCSSLQTRLRHLEGLLNIAPPLNENEESTGTPFGNHISPALPENSYSPGDLLLLPPRAGPSYISTEREHPQKRKRAETGHSSAPNFPPLPGYRAPQHPEAQYSLNILPSRAPSDDEGEVVSSHALTAPFEALAEAAVQSSSNFPSGTIQQYSPMTADRRQRLQRRVKAPPHAFADACQKGIITTAQAREAYDYYFVHVHKWMPLLDPRDSFDHFKQNTAFAFTTMQYVTARARCGNVENNTLNQLSEEAHGIARSTLYALTTRTHSVQAVTLLGAFSSNGYLSSAHALNMALEFGLHRAMAKLVDGSERSSEETDELFVAARTWYTLYFLSYLFAKSSGRPMLLSEDVAAVNPICLAAFLRHPLANQHDISLVSWIELMTYQRRMKENVESFGFQNTKDALPSNVMQFFRHSRQEIQNWHDKWDHEFAKTHQIQSFERQELLRAYGSAKIFLATTALSGKSIVRVEEPNVRELASQAFYSAQEVTNISLNVAEYRSSLAAAPHVVHSDIAFAALLLLKLCRLFLDSTEIAEVASRIQNLANLMATFPGGTRLSNTLQMALRSFSQNVIASSIPTNQFDFTMLDAYTSFDASQFEGFDFNALYPEWNLGSSSVYKGDGIDWTFGNNGIDMLFAPNSSFEGAASAQAW